VRWEPPPKESQNGVITGYKIKLRRAAGKSQTQTFSTDGSRRLYAITGDASFGVCIVPFWGAAGQFSGSF